LAAVDGLGAAGTNGAVAHVGDGVAPIVQAVLVNTYRIAIRTVIEGNAVQPCQILVQGKRNGVTVGSGRNVVVAVDGDRAAQFFDIGTAVVASKGQAFGVYAFLGIDTFADIILRILA